MEWTVAAEATTPETGPADHELVARAVEGDGEAFGLIVRRHQDRLYNVVYRLLGSAEDAQDALQEVFLKAFENLKGFRGTSSLYTWLFRIAVNTALSHRRKRRREPLATGLGPGNAGTGPSGDDAPGLDPADRSASTNPAEPMMAAETEALIQGAIGALDDDHRAVVVLRDIQHCDYHEIAEILGVPTGTVKSRLHRARLVLRDRLRPLLAP